MGKRALSPRTTKRENRPLGEPVIQDPQPTATKEDAAEAPFLSVPSGGPGSEQRWQRMQVYQEEGPAPKPDQASEIDDNSTNEESQTPLGDEPP